MRISDWSSDVCSSDLALIEDAATLGDLGRMRAMLAVTRRAIAADPADPRAYYLQAVLAARAGRFDRARVLLQKTGGTLNGMPAVLLLGGMLDYHARAYEQATGQWPELADLQGRKSVGSGKRGEVS